MSPLHRSVCTTREMQERIAYKAAMALGVPIALFMSATVTLWRSPSEARFAAFGLWVGIVVVGVVAHFVLMRSMRQDLDELRRRWRR
jgi:3-polyprenyl-4-hydroxybenzoate decarboxylase